MKKETYVTPVMEIVLLERGKTVVTSGCGVGDYLNCTGYDPCYLDGSCPSDCSGNCPADGLCSTDGDSWGVYSWLAENAWKYGFILRYPEGKEGITGIDYEPWHYRYVGKEAAVEIHSRGITLEEYLQ